MPAENIGHAATPEMLAIGKNLPITVQQVKLEDPNRYSAKIVGVLAPVTRKYDVRLNVIRGDTSDSYANNIAVRWKEVDKPIFAIYIGDFDPRGINIERVVRDKVLEMSGVEAHWERLAVTEDDMDKDYYFLEAKRSDKLTPAYIRERGWTKILEVDAISPEEIRGKLEDVIKQFIPDGEWDRLTRNQEVEREGLSQFLATYDEK